MSSISNPSELQVTGVAFFGRTFAEYSSFFDLAPAALVGRRMLDVAAGPSSFTAEARSLGIDAVAVDPLYGLSCEALAAYVQIDYARMIAEMRRKPELLRFRHYTSVDAAETDRRAAAARFLSDYPVGFAQSRYVAGALPQLPFADGAFDLVLCAHLLFLYARQFDFAQHVAACRELVRVSAGEVRIHPICGLGGKLYPELPRLLDELALIGIEGTVIETDYEFFAGTRATLVLKAAMTRNAESIVIRREDPFGKTAADLIAEVVAFLAGRYPELADACAMSFHPDDVVVSRSGFFVAYLGGRPVGCGALRPLDDETVEIKRMYVAPAARRRGVGRELLAELERQAAGFGYGLIRLECGVRQPEAIALYESCGFSHIPPFGQYVGKPVSVCFEKATGRALQAPV